jgi:hypothetical protein
MKTSELNNIQINCSLVGDTVVVTFKPEKDDSLINFEMYRTYLNNLSDVVLKLNEHSDVLTDAFFDINMSKENDKREKRQSQFRTFLSSLAPDSVLAKLFLQVDGLKQDNVINKYVVSVQANPHFTGNSGITKLFRTSWNQLMSFCIKNYKCKHVFSTDDMTKLNNRLRLFEGNLFKIFDDGHGVGDEAYKIIEEILVKPQESSTGGKPKKQIKKVSNSKNSIAHDKRQTTTTKSRKTTKTTKNVSSSKKTTRAKSAKVKLNL